MVAASFSPVIKSVPLRGATHVLGQAENLFSPISVDTYYFVPSAATATAPGVKAGYAAFSVDGTSVLRGTASTNINTFAGFALAKGLNEGDPGTNPYTSTMGSPVDAGGINITVPVIRQGSVWVKSTVNISAAPATTTYVLTGGSSATDAQIGTIFQGSLPANVTGIDITNYITVKTVESQADGSYDVLLELMQA